MYERVIKGTFIVMVDLTSVENETKLRDSYKLKLLIFQHIFDFPVLIKFGD